jgi:hypothetical protein
MCFFLLWCLRLTAGDDVPADDDLHLVASGWWWALYTMAAIGEHEVGMKVDGRGSETG